METGGGAVYTIDFDATGRTVFATSQDGSLRAFNLQDGTQKMLAPDVGWGYHVWDVSRDGRYLAGPHKGGIAVWDQKTHRELRVIQGNAGGTGYVAFSPDGRVLASMGRDGVVRLWDVRTGELVATPGDKLGPDGRLRFSLDGRTLIVWGNDRQVHRYGPSKDGRRAPKSPVENAPLPPDFEDDEDE